MEALSVERGETLRKNTFKTGKR